ncbi:Cell fate regulator YaaT, PSP1 superfamily (controls sporulation, competence, biofilm development) [Aristaeella hokkaidonensis]|uniref:Stage 0 sporulation family protein n=1 Tax=Aristaeella hokkaidonensis TaxID=3046382 RepID=A0AC61N2M0_9FIRM|nr:stage 0 sporulation family protein [Aristaeella hokkaidonensis]SNT93032.1 Cell fate regulator YaaT, PSP1 superfamily (controls sporulation, competence, biofilm development) [Aristaeella hokkaidonensis]
MGRIIGVQFQENGKMYYFDSSETEVKTGDYVIVDTARGNDLGEVVMGSREVDEENWHTPLKKVIRIADEQDIKHGQENRVKEKEAFGICQKKIAEHKLEMKLVSVEYAFDNSKILFFFTANGRVDFRSLVKDLASVFKMRIELRQIGVRDEAKMLGGLGPCGRPICCGSFLDQFQPVSIKMAKEQNLSLNPTKISGVCGRLMCCLKYEQEHYEMTRKKMPKIGREVITPDGTGPVTDLNIVKETVFVRLTNGDTSEIKEYPLENITKPSDGNTNQEQARKNNGEEKTDPVYDGFAGKNAQDDLTVKSEESETDEKTIQHGTDSNITNEEKNNRKARKPVLGQPVRRENPNRSHEQKNREEAQAQPDHNEAKETPNSPETSSTRSPWADALQKAMQAISHDK